MSGGVLGLRMKSYVPITPKDLNSLWGPTGNGDLVNVIAVGEIIIASQWLSPGSGPNSPNSFIFRKGVGPYISGQSDIPQLASLQSR